MLGLTNQPAENVTLLWLFNNLTVYNSKVVKLARWHFISI